MHRKNITQIPGAYFSWEMKRHIYKNKIFRRSSHKPHTFNAICGNTWRQHDVLPEAVMLE